MCTRRGSTQCYDHMHMRVHVVAARLLRRCRPGTSPLHSNDSAAASGALWCRPLLTTGGELHITLKLQPPYSAWGVPDMAREAGYVHFTTRDFDFAAFPGYTHKTTEAGATELDTSSEDAKRAIKTLVFRRIAGPAPGVLLMAGQGAVLRGRGSARSGRRPGAGGQAGAGDVLGGKVAAPCSPPTDGLRGAPERCLHLHALKGGQWATVVVRW